MIIADVGQTKVCKGVDFDPFNLCSVGALEADYSSYINLLMSYLEDMGHYLINGGPMPNDTREGLDSHDD